MRNEYKFYIHYVLKIKIQCSYNVLVDIAVRSSTSAPGVNILGVLKNALKYLCTPIEKN